MLVLTHFWQRGSSSQLDRRSEKLKALVYLTAEGSLVWAPPGAHTSCIAFKCMHGQPIPLIQDKQTTGTSLSTFMESTILVMVCVCNSRARVCLWLVPMDRAEIRQQEEERSRDLKVKKASGFHSESGASETLYPEELVQFPVIPLCYCLCQVQTKMLLPQIHLPTQTLFYLPMAPRVALKRSTETINTWV